MPISIGSSQSITTTEPPNRITEREAQALTKLQKTDEWKTVANILITPSWYLFQQSSITERIALAKETFCMDDAEDIPVLNAVLQRLTQLGYERIKEDNTIPYADNERSNYAVDNRSLLESSVIIGTVGFCKKEYAWDEPFIKGLNDEIKDIKLKGLEPVFLSGADPAGIGGRIKDIAQKENIPIITLLTQSGLEQRAGQILIDKRENIIAVPNSEGRGYGWSTSTKQLGLEWITLICLIMKGRMLVAGGGDVAKIETTQGLALEVPMKYYDMLDKSGNPAAISQRSADGGDAIISLLIEGGKLHYSHHSNCFVNTVEARNEQPALMHSPSTTDIYTADSIARTRIRALSTA